MAIACVTCIVAAKSLSDAALIDGFVRLVGAYMLTTWRCVCVVVGLVYVGIYLCCVNTLLLH